MARILHRSRRSRIRRHPVVHSSAEPTKVLAVGNEQRFIEQISGLLADQSRLNLLGGAQDRVQAAERLVLLKPDVVVIDADLDYELGGIDTAMALRTISPSTAFVLISPHSDPERLAMVPRGLGLEWSYLLSHGEIDKEDLISAISCAAWSIPFVDRRIDRSQLGRLQSHMDDAVEQVLRIAKRSTRAKSSPRKARSHGLGYAESASWEGKVETFRLPEQGEDDGAEDEI